MLVNKEKIAPFIPLLKIICELSAFGATGLLLFKDLYFYDWAEKEETILYSIPMVFIFFYWIRSRLDDPNNFLTKLIATDVLMVLLVALRLFGLWFHSGHTLFLLYTFVTTPNRTYRLLCIPVILITAYFKIVVWGDFLTPLIGALMGLILIYYRNVQIKKRKIALQTK